MIIEKLSYTKGEKAAEFAAAGLAACSVGGYFVLMVFGEADTGAVILMTLVTLILFGVCTLCSAVPQHANVFTRPENCSEKQLRFARRAFIRACLVSRSAQIAQQIIRQTTAIFRRRTLCTHYAFGKTLKKNCLSMTENMPARCVLRDTKQALIGKILFVAAMFAVMAMGGVTL